MKTQNHSQQQYRQGAQDKEENGEENCEKEEEQESDAYDSEEDVYKFSCSRCQRMTMACSNEPASTIRQQENGEIYIDCGFYSENDAESFQFVNGCKVREEQWFRDAAVKGQYIGLCDRCIRTYDLLNQIILAYSPWRRPHRVKDLPRRQSESHTSNYKTFWQFGDPFWPRRKSTS